jgi:hypothetical protein
MFQLRQSIDSFSGIKLELDDIVCCACVPIALVFFNSIKWRMRVDDFEQCGKVKDGGVKDGEC